MSRRRIFVVGTGRSGTNWMGEILATHPDIVSFLEPRPVFDLVTSVAVGEQSRATAFPRIFAEYDRLFTASEPFHCADKTHTALWIVDALSAHYPEARFVAMNREVEATVASMMKHAGVRRWCEQWERYPTPNPFLGIVESSRSWYEQSSTLERCVARWSSHHEEICRLQGRLGDRMLQVEYESLVVRPEEQLPRLQHFIGLKKQFPPTRPRHQSLHKWKAHFSLEDLERIRAAVEYLDSKRAPSGQGFGRRRSGHESHKGSGS